MVHEVNVLDGDIFRYRDAGWCEIDNAKHSCLNKIICGPLGAFWRSGDYANLNVKLLNFLFQSARTDNFKTSDFLSDFEGITIKSAYQNKSPAPKNSVPEQGPAKIAHTHEGNVPGSIDPKRLFDSCQQILHIVSHATHAKLSKISEIFANLRGINSAGLGQTIRRDDRVPILKKCFQYLDVDCQPLDCCARYM